jgi:hypothetical protein
LKRDEATSLLKEINEICDGINEQAIMLMPPNSDDVLSHGYQLHIKLPAGNLGCIRPLIKKHGLAMAEEPEKNLLVIYRPIKKEETVAQL